MRTQTRADRFARSDVEILSPVYLFDNVRILLQVEVKKKSSEVGL